MQLLAVKPSVAKIATASVVSAVVVSVALQIALEIPPHLVPLKTGVIAAIVGALWFYFERLGWRCCVHGWRPWKWLCDWPDLNGRWEGELDRHGENSPHRFVLEIYQTYSMIKTFSYSGRSKGSSLIANLATDETRSKFFLIVTWQTRARKLGAFDDGFDEFIGTSVIDMSEDESGALVLEDDYFTRRDPPTRGTVRLYRINKGRRGRFDS